jgi:hypothetical protein
MANSTYNKDLHLRIITNDYFKSVTGLDIIQEEGTTHKASGKTISFHMKAYDSIYFNKSARTKNIINYLIAFNDRWKENWEKYVATYIEIFYYSEKDFVWGDATLPANVFKAAQPINVYNFNDSDLETEIKNSDKEW